MTPSVKTSWPVCDQILRLAEGFACFSNLFNNSVINSLKQRNGFCLRQLFQVFPFETKEWGRLYRVQGVSLPFTQRVNSWTWEILMKAARTKVGKSKN